MVAVPFAIEMARRRLPAGTAVVTPAACSAAFGPAKSRRTAAVATPGTRGTVRLVSHSLPAARSSQTSSVIRGPAWRVAAAVPAAGETARRAATRIVSRKRMRQMLQVTPYGHPAHRPRRRAPFVQAAQGSRAGPSWYARRPATRRIMPARGGVHHIDLAVSDVGRSLAFYLDLLRPLG